MIGYIAYVSTYERGKLKIYYIALKENGKSILVNRLIAKELGMSQDEFEEEMKKFGETTKPKFCVDTYFINENDASDFAAYINDNMEFFLTLKALKGN